MDTGTAHTLAVATLADMQATVSSHDPDTGATAVLTDDGIQWHATGEVFAASGLRFVRPGQRVSIEIDDQQVVRLWIVGIGPGEVIR